MAAIVSHAPSHEAAAANTATRTFTATGDQGGSRGKLRGVVHAGPTLCRDGEENEQKRVNEGENIDLRNG